jgi:hypothetical protein
MSIGIAAQKSGLYNGAIVAPDRLLVCLMRVPINDVLSHDQVEVAMKQTARPGIKVASHLKAGARYSWFK